MRSRRAAIVGVGAAVLVLLACGAVALMALAIVNSDDRSTYKADNLSERQFFFDEYDIAVREGAEWVKDERQLALRYVCGEECGGDELVTAARNGADRATLIVEDNTVFDDSIKAIKQRVDLVQTGDTWQIEWAGWKQQCRRDDWTAIFQGRFGWHTQLCP